MAEGGARWPTTSRHLPKCFAAWPISSTTTTPARPSMKPSPRPQRRWRPAPPLSSWWLGRCGRPTAPACWRRPTPFTLACPDKQPPPPTSRRSSRRAQRRPMVGMKPLQATLPPSWQAILQVGTPSPLRRQARALHQWTQGVCLDLPFTTWTQPMRPSSGRPSPSFGVARSSRAASSSG